MPTVKSNAEGEKAVKEFLSQLQHPLKKEIEEIRKIIIKCDPEITEKIKWNAPSFCYDGDDRITFNLSGKGFIRLIFHCGVKKKDVNIKKSFADDLGLLEWAANDRTVMKFTDMKDVKEKKESLTAFVKQWLKLTKVN